MGARSAKATSECSWTRVPTKVFPAQIVPRGFGEPSESKRGVEKQGFENDVSGSRFSGALAIYKLMRVPSRHSASGAWVPNWASRNGIG